MSQLDGVCVLVELCGEGRDTQENLCVCFFFGDCDADFLSVGVCV